MIEKYQQRSINATYKLNFFEATIAAIKESFRNIEENLCLVNKVINVIQLLVQSDGKTYCCC